MGCWRVGGMACWRVFWCRDVAYSSVSLLCVVVLFFFVLFLLLFLSLNTLLASLFLFSTSSHFYNTLVLGWLRRFFLQNCYRKATEPHPFSNSIADHTGAQSSPFSFHASPL